MNINKLRRYIILVNNDTRLHIATDENQNIGLDTLYKILKAEAQFKLNGITILNSNEFKVTKLNCDEVIVTVLVKDTQNEAASVTIDVSRKMLAITTTSKFVNIDVVDLPEQFGVNPHISNKSFPLWKVEYVEGLRGRDGGSVHADPYNDVVSTCMINYYVRKKLDEDYELYYSESSGSFTYASHRAAITLVELREKFGYFEHYDKCVMFEYQGRMFNNVSYVEKQKCVCGSYILENTSANDDDDDFVKINLLKNHIFGYEENCLALTCGGIYMNGKRLMTKEYLKNEHGIKWGDATSLYPRAVEDKIMELFPDAETYETGSSSGGFNRDRAIKAEVKEDAKKEE